MCLRNGTNSAFNNGICSFVDVAKGGELGEKVFKVTTDARVLMGAYESNIFVRVDTWESGRELGNDRSTNSRVAHADVWRESVSRGNGSIEQLTRIDEDDSVRRVGRVRNYESATPLSQMQPCIDLRTTPISLFNQVKKSSPTGQRCKAHHHVCLDNGTAKRLVPAGST